MNHYYAPWIETNSGAVEMDNAKVVLADDYAKLEAERDRLREMIGTALQVIPRRYEDLSPVKKSRVIRDVMAVLGALQEANDA